MASTQSAAKSVKAAPAAAPKAKAARKVPAGTMEKKAKPIEEQPAPAVPAFEEQRKADRRADDIAKGDRVMQFSAQQAGGKREPTEEEKKLQAFQAELAELAAKHGIAPESLKKVTAKAPRADRVQQNGITRPAADTNCGKIWGLADKLSIDMGGVVSIATLRAHADMKTVNDHTIKTQYARWRKFHNVTGRLPRIHAVQQPQGEYAGLAPIAPTAPAAPEAAA